MRLVTYNVQYSRGRDGRYDLARVAADVADADVIALQEVAANAPGLPEADQPARLGELLHGHAWRYGPALDISVEPHGPEALLLGDFNMLPESPEYVALVGEDDYHHGRTNTVDRFSDCWTLVGNPPSAGATWFEGEVGRRLDYAFVSSGLAASVRAARVDDTAAGSDHQPLWIDLEC